MTFLGFCFFLKHVAVYGICTILNNICCFISFFFFSTLPRSTQAVVGSEALKSRRSALLVLQSTPYSPV